MILPLQTNGRQEGADFSPVEKGILWPVVYASIFGSPVGASRLREQIVGVRVTEDEMRASLDPLIARGIVIEDEGEVWLRSAASADTIAAFRRRTIATAELLNRHLKIVAFVRGLRGVRLAALSGGCAHGTADDGDIDVFVVTEPGALWQTLLRVMLVAKARGWRRILCVNYLVDATAQALPWQDFYSGIELISLKPIRGALAFSDLLDENPWVQPMFPNFLPSRPRRQNSGNRVSTGSLRRLLEATARMIQRPYLRQRLPQGKGVELSEHVIRLHSTDHRSRLRDLFHVALKDIGLEAPAWI